ncbi:MAG TPA: RidA family protein [Actinomycetota bacterium]|nr:RidA family protein [Actinomycetota bacterium]
MEGALTPHRIVNPETLPPPAGFAHAVVAAPGRTVYLGGQIGDGPTMSAQFASAARNVVTALRAAGAEPEHLVSLTIFVTDVEEYRKSLSPIGASYRKHFGKHYPAMALFEVSGLFDPAARVELVGVAVVPD